MIPPALGRSHRASVGEAASLPTARTLAWTWLGRVDYAPTATLQETLRTALHAARERGAPADERLLLLEHAPVFTLGRNASAADLVTSAAWRAARGVAVHESNRGGQVTYHGPGQLVGYPILDLHPDRRDVRRYVRDLQEVLIRTLADCGLTARRHPEHIGVWLEPPGMPDAPLRKIASIGVHLRRWIPIHGFALNVDARALEPFSGIVPCGLRDVTMTAIAEWIPPPSLAALAARVAAHASDVFGRTLRAASATELDALRDSANAGA
ncbi:MAG: lipoyl(octanoyl) transferase LipB [Acidobacteriota bacterium]